jgi:hypothetical protein
MTSRRERRHQIKALHEAKQAIAGRELPAPKISERWRPKPEVPDEPQQPEP